ncbi:unnamed protein product [Fraxinus pennsylvanica]|uniref:Uncharacterized protein n=1 Tax=Fraxinus pennsylvanica TaxID=56036 RepID=A0AAD2E4I0_9LAMI|nr:unnamed protein product [Fraxinus pennsylvanica]
MAESKVSLKLMIDTKSKSLISAEAGKDSWADEGCSLKPKVQTPITSVPLLLLNDAPTEKCFYKCPDSYPVSFITDDPTVTCPNCRKFMKQQIKYIAPARVNQLLNAGGGLVKGVVTYMVMDDLMVKPVSAISSIASLNQFNVKEVGTLQEKEVNFGMKEALKLLKASLCTNKVLTTVFLNDI